MASSTQTDDSPTTSVPAPTRGGLLLVEWRVINEEGITYGNRVYDSAELNPYRRTGSGVQIRNGRWELHHDPYDVTAIWVRNHHHGGGSPPRGCTGTSSGGRRR